jgi:pimeloyl-ACP methyl ester carboxylesterase
VAWVRQRFDCTDASSPAAPPPERRIAVVVSGLGTGSESNSAWELDTAAMGYADVDVVRFSYSGGRAPGPGAPERSATRVASGMPPATGGLADIPVTGFTAADSQQDLMTSAGRLEDLLAAVARAEPGVPIDVIAHSQGGVVSRLAVVRGEADGRLPADVENLVTVGSPHQGAPLATAVVALQQTPGGRVELRAIRASGAFPDLDDRHPSIPQLSETSTVLADMRAAPIPDGVRFTSLGASGDLTVPGTTTADPQADTQVILPTAPSLDAHGALTSDPRTTREITLAISGAAPTCQGLGDAVMAFGQAELVRAGETGLALGAQEVGMVLPPDG